MQLTPKKVLVPVDFSAPSLAGLAAARAMARRWDAALDLVFVDEFPPPALTQGARRRQAAELAKRWEGFEARLRAAAAEAPHLSVRAVEGSPVPELLEAARGADLVVLGTHGRRGLRRAVLGSVAEALMRRSPVPVLAVRGPQPSRWPTRILVPFTLASYADDALGYALSLAAALECETTVVHVVEDPYGRMDVELGLRERVLEAAERCDAPEPAILVEYGRPAPRILRAAARLRSDLVVLSGHRRGVLASATAQRLLRAAPMPVLCVPYLPLGALGRKSASLSASWPWRA